MRLQSSTGHRLIFPGIKPHTEAVLRLPGLPTKFTTEAHLHVDFLLAHDTNWAPAGHKVAWGQVQVHKPESKTCLQLQSEECIPSTLTSSTLRVTNVTPTLLSISNSTGSNWHFDLAEGTLVRWSRPHHPNLNILTEPLTIDFYRALTDNDRGGRFGKEWKDRRLHQTKQHPRSVRWSQDARGVTITVEARVAPPVLAWSVDLTTFFRFQKDSLVISVRGRPQGPRKPDTFARIGLTLGVGGAERARWWGRGPGESYSDKKMSQAFGNWEQGIDDLFTDYEFPQDGGNRTDVRWVEILGRKSEAGVPAEESRDLTRLLRARFGDLDGASFSAMHYTTKDLDECRHPYELYERKRDDTIVRLDWAHHGLGTGSCGPATLPQYELKADDFAFDVLLD